MYRITNEPCPLWPTVRVFDGEGMERWGFYTIHEGGNYSFDCAAELSAGKVYQVELTSKGGGAEMTVNVEAAAVYSITVDNTSEHGTIDWCEPSAYVGKLVDIGVRPDEDYEWTGLIVTDEDGNLVDTERGFIMPASNVTVKATFEKMHRIMFKLDDMVGEPAINIEGRMWNWEDARRCRRLPFGQ